MQDIEFFHSGNFKKGSQKWLGRVLTVVCSMVILITMYGASSVVTTNSLTYEGQIVKKQQVMSTSSTRAVSMVATAALADIDKMEYDMSDRNLLAAIIFCESGAEPYDGKLAVGYTIMNRVKSSKYPDTISEVVYQKGQFAPVGTGFLALVLGEKRATEDCYRAADAVFEGSAKNPIGDSLFFRTYKGSSIQDRLKANGLTYTIIGKHIFYKVFV